MQIKNVYTLVKEWGYWQWQSRIYYKGNWFLCSRGVGDTVIFLSKISEYKKKYPDKKVNVIVSETHVPIVNFYCDLIDEICVLPYKKMCDTTQIAFGGLLPQNIKYILPISSYQMLGYKNMSIFDLMNLTLELGECSEYLRPPIQDLDTVTLELLKKYNDDNEKYVIMAPTAVSVNSIDGEVWISVYNLLVENGYKVLINGSPNEKNVLFDLADYINVPIDQIYLLAEKAALFIGLRSGLCDLLAFSKCNMVVAYPNTNGKTFFDKYTFKNMPFEKKIVECFEGELFNVVKQFVNESE